ncbi:uncharacterized protein LOC109704191 isoform X7 [Ananas comosus]|uniref:Uncharacterized protein LOC109704191 isoform X7 n=1 Tax=Ananas comosus TaxID=4615 RepID=A0A6P5EBC3_ANACO|nr:uncharacterized protein LOC109704191 isoform X7 [Ananas comosus]
MCYLIIILSVLILRFTLIMRHLNTHSRHPTSDPSHPTSTHKRPMQMPSSNTPLPKQFKPRGAQPSLHKSQPTSKHHGSRSNQMQLPGQNHLCVNRPSSSNELERIVNGHLVRPSIIPSRPHLMHRQGFAEDHNILYNHMHDNYNENHSVEDEIQEDHNVPNAADSTRKSKNKRGPTRMLKIWATRDDKLLPQKFNEFDQPIGDDATKFTNFLGTVLKYDIEDDSMSWVIKALGKKWKDFKCELKKKHYDAHKTYEKRVADRDPRVIPDQWKHLVDFSNSEEGQARCLRNKVNRSKQVTLHTAGSKSFARIREEERKNKGILPTRAELFKITHIHKDGAPVNAECASKISDIDKITMDNPEKAKKALKEGDLFLEVFGKERHGHVRGLGLGPCPTDIWSSMPSRATSVRMAYEAKRKAEEETRGMQEKMAAMEQEQIELKAKLAKMEAKMDAWQRSPNDFHQSNSIETRVQNVANVNEDAANGLERDAWSSSSSSTHAIPTHRIHHKKMRMQHEISQNEGGKEVTLMSLGKPHRPVARGILFSRDPSTIVGEEKLGHHYWEVYIEVVIMPNESLIRSLQNLKTIGDVAQKSIAWPSYLVKEDGK